MFRLPGAATVLCSVLALSLGVGGCTSSGTQSPSGASGTQTPALYSARATFTDPPANSGAIQNPVSGHALDLGATGYTQQEFFASGTAHAFRATSAPANGNFVIVPTTSAPYKTRILVRRPIDPSKFSGTVVVEWLNVSEGESNPDWDYLNPYLTAAGDAWVGVSAQYQGVEGGAPVLGSVSEGSTNTANGLVQDNPARYSSLHHPGDQYALDIFDQIGLGVRAAHTQVLGSVQVKHIVAAGESQSAFYLTTFTNALQPLSHTFQGIFIHSRGGNGAALNGASISKALHPGAQRIRTDLTIPVFMFETQTDMVELGYAPAQQPNTRYIHTWEVAGTSHADNYVLGSASPSILGCTTPINTGPQHTVVQAAFASFMQWVESGKTPPTPERFALKSLNPTVLAVDANGNVIGGVRTPSVDVPISTLSGSAPKGSSTICSLFGQTIPFSSAKLTSLYGSPAHYLELYKANLDKAIAGGYILPADRAQLLQQAEAVQF
jgi:Alpha/beta hydrolase domain